MNADYLFFLKRKGKVCVEGWVQGFYDLLLQTHTRHLCRHFLLWFSVHFNPSEKSVLTIQSLTYFIALNDRSLLVIHDQQIVKDFNQLISG